MAKRSANQAVPIAQPVDSVRRAAPSLDSFENLFPVHCNILGRVDADSCLISLNPPAHGHGDIIAHHAVLPTRLVKMSIAVVSVIKLTLGVTVSGRESCISGQTDPHVRTVAAASTAGHHLELAGRRGEHAHNLLA
jgi:hypothetical protein